MTMHMTPQELRRRLEAARSTQAGSAQRIQAHRELAEQCPACVPNLLALSQSLQLDRQEEADAQSHFAESERALEQEKLDAALELASRAQRMFPDSEAITEAVEFAKQCAAR